MNEEPTSESLEPITHGGPDRSYKLCKCSSCGDISTCTPNNDFYTTDPKGTGPLFCEGCLWSNYKKDKK